MNKGGHQTRPVKPRAIAPGLTGVPVNVVLTVLLVLAALDLLLWGLMLLGALAASRDRRHVLGLAPIEVAEPLPSVSILFPARDEAEVIGPAITSALAQDYPDLEVLLIDDNSTDGTAEVALAAAAADPRFRLLTGTPLAQGWKGKPWALWQAQQQARGELLLFVDADVVLSPLATRRAVETLLSRELDLLSAWGTWIMDSVGVKVALPVVGGFVRGAHPLDRVNDPAQEAVFANGQFILMRRTAYDAMGGHTAVKDEVLEDVRLAQAVRRAGQRGGMVLAPDWFRVRLYTTLPALWSGTVKNFYAGMGQRAGLAALAALFVAYTALFPLVALAAGAVTGDLVLTGVALGALALMALFRTVQDRPLGLSPICALTHPVGASILLGVIVTSAWRGARGKATTWKGRPV